MILILKFKKYFYNKNKNIFILIKYLNLYLKMYKLNNLKGYPNLIIVTNK